MDNKLNVLIQQAFSLFQMGRLEQAQDYLLNLLENAPDHPRAIQILGGIKMQMRDYRSAADLFNRAININPNLASNYNNLGCALHMLGRLEEAKRQCERAIELKPDFPEAYNTLAAILKDLGKNNDALYYCQCVISTKPDFYEVYITYAAVLLALSKFREACEVCRRFIEHRQEIPEINNLLVNALTSLGDYVEAANICESSITKWPDYAALYNSYGNLLNETGKVSDALLAFDDAIVRNPDNSVALYNRANVLSNLGLFEAAKRDYRALLEIDPENHEAHSNLLFLLAAEAELSYDEMLTEQLKWNDKYGEEGRMNRCPERTSVSLVGARLRIGYISPDFRKHPVGYFFEGLLASHNKSMFDIYCYSNMQEAKGDHLTERLREQSSHWSYVEHIDDKELARQINNDNIDVLVDLAGHTRGNRLKVFTYKPARVQVTYLGYCASSGIEEMDYWLTDEVLHPHSTKELSVESIYRLPRCSFCYKPPSEANIPVTVRKSESGVVFASYSHLSKIGAPVIEAWSKILKSVHNSQLVIMDRYMDDSCIQEKLICCFKKHGVNPDSLVMLGHTNYQDYYSSYTNVDIVLDPFPRTGGTTTADALWMGVPVITLCGERYVERISASKLHALELDELISTNVDQYIRVAIKIAKDTGYRRELRKRLRNHFIHSDLSDGAGLALAIESAYCEMLSKSNNK